MLYIILFFILGLLFGSFLNLALYRVPKNKSLIFGRSKCDYCNHKLSFTDLIPLFSYILLKGRCKYCKKRLPVYLPLVEFFSALSFALSYFYAFNIYQGTLPLQKYIFLVFSLFLSLILVYSFFYDLLYYEIPFKPVIAGYFLWIFYTVFNFFYYRKVFLQSLNDSKLGAYLLQTSFLNDRLIFYIKETLTYNLITALLIFLFLLVLHLVTKGRGMGFGDVYFAPLLALISGFPVSIVYFFSSFVLGSLYGLTTIILKKQTLKSRVPFGPFLILGFLLSLTFFKIYTKFFI